MSYQVITKNDTQFSSLKNGFNQRWFAENLKAVYLCYNSEDVKQALENSQSTYAISAGELRVVCGAHCYENFIYNGTTKVIIDTTGLKNFSFDESADIATIGVGYTNWEIAKKLFKEHNLQLPAGSCYSVGLGGHITGGGYGLSSRAYGLTVDSLCGYTIVVASDEGFDVINVDCSSELDLSYGIRGGGGGNFGIITSYSFNKLPPAWASADIFAISINWSDITSWTILKSILQVYSTYCANNGTSVDPEKQEWSKNIFGLGKFTHKQSKQIVFAIQSAWTDAQDQKIQFEQVKNFVTDLSNIDGLTVDYIRYKTPGHAQIPDLFYGAPVGLAFDINSSYASQSMSWLDATMSLNGSGANQRGCYNSAYFRTMLVDTQIQGMYKYLSGQADVEGLDYSQALIQIDSYGGKINEYAGAPSAIKQRDSIMKGQFQIYWNDGYQNSNVKDESYVNWMKNFYNEMFVETGGFPDPYSSSEARKSVDGCYINYPNSILGTNTFGAEIKESDTPDIYHAMRLYYGIDIMNNLIEIKEKYDSNNFFRHAQSIPVKKPQKLI